MQLINISKEITLAQEVMLAEKFWSRFKGLMGTSKLPENKALLIKPCSSIHTWFMKYPIDVIFLDYNNQVVHILHAIVPYRFSPLVRSAKAVVKLPAGRCYQTGTKTGDLVKFYSCFQHR